MGLGTKAAELSHLRIAGNIIDHFGAVSSTFSRFFDHITSLFTKTEFVRVGESKLNRVAEEAGDFSRAFSVTSGGDVRIVNTARTDNWMNEADRAINELDEAIPAGPISNECPECAFNEENRHLSMDEITRQLNALDPSLTPEAAAERYMNRFPDETPGEDMGAFFGSTIDDPSLNSGSSSTVDDPNLDPGSRTTVDDPNVDSSSSPDPQQEFLNQNKRSDTRNPEEFGNETNDLINPDNSDTLRQQADDPSIIRSDAARGNRRDPPSGPTEEWEDIFNRAEDTDIPLSERNDALEAKLEFYNGSNHQGGGTFNRLSPERTADGNIIARTDRDIDETIEVLDEVRKTRSDLIDNLRRQEDELREDGDLDGAKRCFDRRKRHQADHIDFNNRYAESVGKDVSEGGLRKGRPTEGRFKKTKGRNGKYKAKKKQQEIYAENQKIAEDAASDIDKRIDDIDNRTDEIDRRLEDSDPSEREGLEREKRDLDAEREGLPGERSSWDDIARTSRNRKIVAGIAAAGILLGIGVGLAVTAVVASAGGVAAGTATYCLTHPVECAAAGSYAACQLEQSNNFIESMVKSVSPSTDEACNNLVIGIACSQNFIPPFLSGFYNDFIKDYIPDEIKDNINLELTEYTPKTTENLYDSYTMYTLVYPIIAAIIILGVICFINYIFKDYIFSSGFWISLLVSAIIIISLNTLFSGVCTYIYNNKDVDQDPDDNSKCYYQSSNLKYPVTGPEQSQPCIPNPNPGPEGNPTLLGYSANGEAILDTSSWYLAPKYIKDFDNAGTNTGADSTGADSTGADSTGADSTGASASGADSTDQTIEYNTGKNDACYNFALDIIWVIILLWIVIQLVILLLVLLYKLFKKIKPKLSEKKSKDSNVSDDSIEHEETERLLSPDDVDNTKQGGGGLKSIQSKTKNINRKILKMFNKNLPYVLIVLLISIHILNANKKKLIKEKQKLKNYLK